MTSLVVYVLSRLQGCWSCLEPLLPEETKEQVERRQMVERGANFTKRSFTLGGFALRSQQVYVHVKEEDDKLALVWRPTDDPRGHEIQAGDIKTIAPNGAKAITVLSKTGDVLLEVEAASEELRDQWMTGLNEVLLNRVVGEDGVVLGLPRNLKERAEKELYFSRKQKELEQKKKQTDERKSKLMKELGGGLKYTALSMASRASAATEDGEAAGRGRGGGGGGGGGGS